MKKIVKDPQSIFYIGVPKGKDFLTSVSAMEKTIKGNRYILFKRIRKGNGQIQRVG